MIGMWLALYDLHQVRDQSLPMTCAHISNVCTYPWEADVDRPAPVDVQLKMKRDEHEYQLSLVLDRTEEQVRQRARLLAGFVGPFLWS